MPLILTKIYETLVPYEKRLTFYKWRHPNEFRELRQKINPSPKGDFSLKPFDEHQAIFVHITKTAGTSVAKSLFGYLPYHYTAIQYRVFYGKNDFKKYFKFAFVRNPWDRLYSAFRYLKSGGWNKEDKKWAETHLSQFDDFNDFVNEWLTTENIQKHMHFKPQHEFICDSHGNILIDYLAYFETLEKDFEIITTQLDIDAKLGTHNVNPGKNYKDIYSDDSKSKVGLVYEKDVALFGYNFDGIESRRDLSSHKNLTS